MKSKTTKKEKVIIFGCGGHSRSVADVLIDSRRGVDITFIDGNAEAGETIFGFPVLKEIELKSLDMVFIAIGDNQKRKAEFERLSDLNIISIISGKSHLGKNSAIGRGCFIGNYSHIGPSSSIGDDTVINNGAVVDHEVEVGPHCHIGPNATISGRSRLGSCVFIGVGATVIDGITICDNAMVGMESTVIMNIVASGIYTDSPAVKTG
ncbi:MAG: NeuD/PglB/VioB family sugar acetyltransferase [Spirochaetes bacterium]|jgi:sugar O-acyltransferase (sialic acid O-acetyltransferase NeuD family)|nr:NeuD/PglB/VioB family sugar acetyltransferase [Spirochaetota bacterium]